MVAAIIEYLEDRYPIFEDVSLAAYDYACWLKEQGFSILDKPYGFITYKFQGDACIIFDIYTQKEFRKTKKAWQLWTEMLKHIQSNPNCHVVIGFSEHIGTNPADGVGAMLAAGFVQAYDTKEQAIYLRGTQ